MPRVHLPAKLYASLQNFVHKGHGGTADTILLLLEPQRGDVIVEIGCGTGIFARHILAGGFKYIGIDSDGDRIATARKLTPGARFELGDALSFDWSQLPAFRHVFVHGILHHLNDGECRQLIDRVLSLRGSIALAIIEPFKPRRSWRHPVWAALAALDEGAFVRTLPEWAHLYGERADVFEPGRWARWPVRRIVSRLHEHAPRENSASVSVQGAIPTAQLFSRG
jgi:trans-aconitate methyltransferase